MKRRKVEEDEEGFHDLPPPKFFLEKYFSPSKIIDWTIFSQKHRLRCETPFYEDL